MEKFRRDGDYLSELVKTSRSSLYSQRNASALLQDVLSVRRRATLFFFPFHYQKELFAEIWNKTCYSSLYSFMRRAAHYLSFGTRPRQWPVQRWTDRNVPTVAVCEELTQSEQHSIRPQLDSENNSGDFPREAEGVLSFSCLSKGRRVMHKRELQIHDLDAVVSRIFSYPWVIGTSNGGETPR